MTLKNLPKAKPSKVSSTPSGTTVAVTCEDSQQDAAATSSPIWRSSYESHEFTESESEHYPSMLLKTSKLR